MSSNIPVSVILWLFTSKSSAFNGTLWYPSPDTSTKLNASSFAAPELLSPPNAKYLKTLLKSIVLVIDNLSEQFNFKLYFSEKYIDIKNIDLFANMKDYNKLYITISHRTK